MVVGRRLLHAARGKTQQTVSIPTSSSLDVGVCCIVVGVNTRFSRTIRFYLFGTYFFCVVILGIDPMAFYSRSRLVVRACSSYFIFFFTRSFFCGAVLNIPTF